MATMNISLPDAMKAWVEEQAKTGRYSNASDYVRDLIRRDEQHREAMSWLEAEIAKGFEGGAPAEIDREIYLASLRERASAHRKT